MARFHAYILDLDGVVYRGNLLLPGAREFVTWADASGAKVIYLSNNSFATPEEVAAKLARLGMPRPESRTITAGSAAIQAVAGRFPRGRVLILGVESVARMARAAGLEPVWRDDTEGGVPDAVLVGLDRGLTYERLARAQRAVLGGATFYAVNRDHRLPVENGFEPGTGAMVAALEYCTGVRAIAIGKPEPAIVLEALAGVGARPDETLMIGDGLDLDIVAGHRAGVTTALVLTGLTDKAAAEAATGERKPDMIAPDLVALLRRLQREG